MDPNNCWKWNNNDWVCDHSESNLDAVEADIQKIKKLKGEGFSTEELEKLLRDRRRTDES